MDPNSAVFGVVDSVRTLHTCWICWREDEVRPAEFERPTSARRCLWQEDVLIAKVWSILSMRAVVLGVLCGWGFQAQMTGAPLVRIAELESILSIFETYADRDAYESHLKTAHFLKYKAGTQHMIKALRLLETEPIRLGVKAK